VGVPRIPWTLRVVGKRRDLGAKRGNYYIVEKRRFQGYKVRLCNWDRGGTVRPFIARGGKILQHSIQPRGQK